jgi:hypothetical protein
MAVMVRLMILLLCGSLLAGCDASPPAHEADCCSAPAPGTAKAQMGGYVAVGAGFTH